MELDFCCPISSNLHFYQKSYNTIPNHFYKVFEIVMCGYGRPHPSCREIDVKVY